MANAVALSHPKDGYEMLMFLDASDSHCVCVISSHLFWTSSSLDVPARVTQEEGHTVFFIHLPSAVHAFIFLARRNFSHFFPSSTVKSKFWVLMISSLAFFTFLLLFFSEEKSRLPGFKLTPQHVRRLRGYQLSYRGDRLGEFWSSSQRLSLRISSRSEK